MVVAFYGKGVASFISLTIKVSLYPSGAILFIDVDVKGGDVNLGLR